MNLTCVQLPTPVYDRDKNYEIAETMVREACLASARPDVVLLPELWNVGYYPKEGLLSEADRDGARTCALMGALAREYGVNIAAGTVVTSREGRVYNTAYVFDRAGKQVYRYDKAHLYLGYGEGRRFTGGSGADVFYLDDVCCGFVVCFDIRFPELARKLYLKGAELYLDPLQWTEDKFDLLEVMARSRALENEAYFVCCNSAGHCFGREYPGKSFAVDYCGRVQKYAGTEPGFVSFSLDTEALRADRARFHLRACRRPELY